MKKRPMHRGKTKNRKIRYAVVGLGHLAQVAVLPGFAGATNSELVALVSGDRQKARKVARQYNIDRIYSYDQYEDCLSEGVDAVYIVLPNHLHSAYTLRAAKAGVHILCEKPMAVSSIECREMIKAARDHKCKLMIGYRLHFEQGNLQAIKMAQSGKFGEVRYFSSDFSQQVVADNIRLTQPTSKGGGPLYDMGVYCINAARYLFRAEPEEVIGTVASVKSAKFAKTDEMVSVVMRFPRERIATFTVSFGAAEMDRYSLVGTKGSLRAEPGFEYAGGINLKAKVGEKTKTLNFRKRDQFSAEISYFSECILKNKDPEPSGEEGLADVRIVEAIYKSVSSGKVVRLETYEKFKRPSMAQEISKPAHSKPKTINVESPSGEAA